MRARCLVAVAGIALVSWAAAGCEMDPPPVELTGQDREAIDALADRYVELTLAGDFDGVAELFHEDGLRMPPDAPAEDGRDAIRRGLEPEEGLTVADFSVDQEEVEGVGDRAYARGTYEITLAADVANGNDGFGAQEEIEEEGKYLTILQRDEEEPTRWTIYRHMTNRDHPPERPDEDDR